MYTSESRALATLEVSVHLDFYEDLPTDRYYVEIEIPDDVDILELKKQIYLKIGILHLLLWKPNSLGTTLSLK